MRRFVCVILMLLTLTGLTLTVSAQSGGRNARSEATMSSDGSCKVVFSMNLVLEEKGDPKFRLPADAEDITLNGTSVTGKKDGDIQHLSLKTVTGGNPGSHSITLSYTLPGVVERQKEGMTLDLPILSGFELPMESFSFSVRLPGKVTSKPSFECEYFGSDVSRFMDITVEGDTIRGVSNAVVWDSMTLDMHLDVEKEMFSQFALTSRTLDSMDLVSLAVAVLALAYFFLTMYRRRSHAQLRTMPPDGVSAGECALWLSGYSMDLSLMVVSWAQMGYLRIEIEGEGRVRLHQRMEMGNERSVLENRLFKELFGTRQSVDATGDHYARLCRYTSRLTARRKEVFHRRSGNPWIFRVLCTLSAMFSGVVMAGGFFPHQVALRIAIGVVAGVLALCLQSAAKGVLYRDPLPLYIGLGCGFVWLVAGIFAGDWLMTGLMVAFNFLAGFAVAYGGRRTELGQTAVAQLLGLRTHLRHVPKPEMVRLMKANPGYFYAVAPYALALNVDRAMAHHLGQLRVPECPFLSDGREQLTAAQWCALLRKTVSAMDAKAKKMSFQQLNGR